MSLLSFSQINTYRKCPRSYYLKYILRIKSPIISPQLEFGSKVHDKIANGVFVSNDPIERDMLDRAKNFLSVLPPNPIFETKYSDGDANPGRFYGDIFGHRTVGVFDFHFLPDRAIGGDWKTGKFKKTYSDQYDIQGYILNELYRQKYDQPLKKFFFKFLADDNVYEAPIHEEKTRKKVEKTIKSALSNVELCKFEKKCGPLCAWCDVSMFCPMEL